MFTYNHSTPTEHDTSTHPPTHSSARASLEADAERDTHENIGSNHVENGTHQIDGYDQHQPDNTNDVMDGMTSRHNHTYSISSTTSSTSQYPTTSVIDIDDLSCPLCADLLYDPVTTPTCGHTFCRSCFALALEFKKFCPLCSEVCSELDVLTLPTTTYFANLIEKLFPQQYRIRSKQIKLQRKRRKQRYNIFISTDVQFPHSHLSLHLYEPRYRVLVNRTLSGSRQFIVAYVPYDRVGFVTPHPPSSSSSSSSHPHRHLNQEQQLNSIASNNATEINRNLYPAEMLRHVLQRQQPHNDMNHHNRSSSSSSSPSDSNNNGNNNRSGTTNASLLPHPVHEGDIACLVRLGRCRAFPDGRSLIEATGVKRVKLMNIREEANAYGLLSAEVEELNDENDDEDDDSIIDSEEHGRTEHAQHEADTTTANITKTTTPRSTSSTSPSSSTTTQQQSGQRLEERQQRIKALVANIHHLLSQYIDRSNTTLQRIELNAGVLPSEPTELAYYISRISPVTPDMKYAVLCADSVVDRLTIAIDILNSSNKHKESQSRQHSMIVLLVMLIAILYQFIVHRND